MSLFLKVSSALCLGLVVTGTAQVVPARAQSTTNKVPRVVLAPDMMPKPTVAGALAQPQATTATVPATAKVSTPKVVLAPTTAAPAVKPVVMPQSYRPMPAGATRTTKLPDFKPSDRVVQGFAVPPQTLSTTTPIIPEHVYVARQEAGTVTMPPGYRPVFEDGRLNPNRGVQTIGGQAQMQYVWTDTVPRRLVPVDLNNRQLR